MRSRKLLSILLSGVMLLTLLGPPAAAAQTYYGDVLVAVNPNLSSNDLTSGSFASETLTEALPEASSICQAPETGEELTILSVNFPKLVPVAEPTDLPILFSQALGADYAVGSTRSFKDRAKADRSVTCLYVGQHCTVWGATDDDPAICITPAVAQEIGQHFDGYYDQMTSAFGQAFDTDGDGKLAIMCYDIDNNYPADISAYTAGFFNAADLVDANGRINGINFGKNNYANGMDCIHLDTYPGMGGKSDPLGVVSRSYSTLVHEFQHLINFSRQVAGGTHASYIDSMEAYLDEAFAMAAEHMVCGADFCTNRISYFNDSRRYSPGTPLTYWAGNLSGYSNSYLFGQYIRTRYGQLTDTDGSTLFKAVLDARTPANEGDTLGLIADILETTPDRLVRDFWAALYLKQDSGPLGFGGEAWAESISPVISSTSNTSNIYNGGAKFYSLGEAGFTPASASDLVFLSLDETGIVTHPMTTQAQMETNENGIPVTVTVQTEDPGYAMVAFYNTSGQMVDLCMAPITPGTNTVDLSGLEGDLANCTWKILVTDMDYSPLCEAFAP